MIVMRYGIHQRFQFVPGSLRQMILKEKPQIVVTDIKMPLMDGLQLIDECKRRKLQVPSVM